MADTTPKTHNLRQKDALARVKSRGGELLNVLLSLADDKLKRPYEISLSGDVITIASSEIQLLETDGSGSTQNSYKKAPTPSGDGYSIVAQSTINVDTGAATGDAESATPSIPVTVGASEYVWMGIEKQDDGKIYFLFGEPNAVSGSAGYPDFTIGDGFKAIAMVLLQDDGSGSSGTTWNFNAPSMSDFIIFEASGGGGGGGVVEGEVDTVSGITGTTVTFSETFRYGKNTGFYRNGARMRLVSSFSTGSDSYAEEYMEVNNGSDSTQITLHSGYPAESDEWFMMELAKATGSVVVANYSRIYADGTDGYQATVTTPSGNTQVNISGWADTAGKLPDYGFSGIWVIVNGQVIERNTTGDGSDTYYTEVTSAGSITGFLFNKDLTNGGAANPEIQIIYFMAQSDINLLNLDSDIVPDEDNTRSIGSSSKQIKEVRTKTLYVDGVDISMSQVALTVTGNNSWSTTRAVGIKYQTLDGTWRLRFNIVGGISSASSGYVEISGIKGKNVSAYYQSVSVASDSNVRGSGFMYPNQGRIDYNVSSSVTNISISGDIELNEEPSW